MKKIVYIVATRHRYQGCKRPNRLAKKTELDQFKVFLTERIQDLGIGLLPEEMSEEALAKYPHPNLPAKQSVPFQVARQLNIDSAYCDPDSAMRKILGISENNTADDNEKREAYWLKRLEERNNFPCLFILGEDHVDSFAALLRKSGFQSIFMARKWGPAGSN
jgi:hypothetical protein